MFFGKSFEIYLEAKHSLPISVGSLCDMASDN